ncbi:uncharacterized protein BX664DRAFT_334362 [Halteromyces radiatus]|uniref:uncharacterized protein n=1 Tax=Halteromyces radiatus TaxID=101107 RepID=UPI00221EDFF4|nr:uncharacterized protein BX664DRAFT_334362 [Halteromyces radiatus]KAI8089978.1 hypothetical protein BX664DRAFT_334362 [Halteromyces radiatus]
MAFNRQSGNDQTFHTTMHPTSSLNPSSMHASLFQNNMGLSWPPALNPSMDLHSVTSPTSPDGSSLSSLPVASPKPHDNKNNNENNNTTPPVDLSKPYHSEWGVMKEQDFHPLTLKHQRDLENIYNTNNPIADFYFWQANLGGYCMADMIQNIVVSSEGAFPLIRRIVEGAPHPGRRKKKRVQA